jgi:NAD(P)-dependent dehydrogenase (short-subunit alcohol dehydrogenase family)
MSKRNFVFGISVAGAVLAATVLRRRAHLNLADKHVLITGGSRGLGLVLAREFLSRGSRVTITARDSQDLAAADEQLRKIGSDVLAIAADMTMREEVDSAIEKATASLGAVDVLVNNAGHICVGPEDTMTVDDFRDSINTHFWAAYFATSAVLPAMKARHRGRIMNISSIGGKIGVPHLLPYCVGKFALTGYSEGLRSELSKYNIAVTTVCPGLMRTGSPRNALFKGENEKEYAGFSISDNLPGLSMSAKHAARRIVDACVRGDAELVLSPPAIIAVKFHGLCPGATADLLGVADRLLPGSRGSGKEARTGAQSDTGSAPAWITKLNDDVARENNEIPQSVARDVANAETG